MEYFQCVEFLNLKQSISKFLKYFFQSFKETCRQEKPATFKNNNIYRISLGCGFQVIQLTMTRKLRSK